MRGASKSCSLPRVLLPEGGGKWMGKSNLAFALLRLPKSTRRDMLIFYKFCRELDDLADEDTRPVECRAEVLEQWRDAILGRLELPMDFGEVVKKYRIPQSLLLAIHEGVSSDLQPRSFATRADLFAYCEKVAVAVGLVANRILGCKSAAADHYAHGLGMALQLTNILRDVREDAGRGRIYFSDEDLQNSGVTREELLALRPGHGFHFLWHRQAEIAEGYFFRVASGPPAEDRIALRPAEIMGRIYYRLLQQMIADGGRVFQKTYRLSWREKFFLLLRG